MSNTVSEIVRTRRASEGYKIYEIIILINK